MEKLKDLLHDFTDVLLAIGIVVVMFAVVTMNLGDWFDGDTNVAFADSTPPVNMATTDHEENETNVEEDDAEVVEEDSNESTEETTEKTTEAPSEETTEKVAEKPAVVTVVEVKKITIPDGTPGVNIAKILQENGLVEKPAEFIKVAENLNLDLKLKSGTFDIPINATIEEMVKIIARAK